jgi:hypothetical protein
MKGMKLGGRTKGTPNKATQKIKDAYAKLLEDNLGTLQTDLSQLEPKDRLNFMLNLSEYILPKLARVEAEHEIKDTSVVLNIIPVAPKQANE